MAAPRAKLLSTFAGLFDTDQWAVTHCGWEGNRMSGVALLMRNSLHCLSNHLSA